MRILYLISLCLLIPHCGKKPSGPENEDGNTPPVARISGEYSSEPDDPLKSYFFFFAYESSDAEDSSDSLEVRWDWEDDGVWDTSWSFYKQRTHHYEIGGQYTVVLQVRDTGGLIDTCQTALRTGARFLRRFDSGIDVPSSPAIGDDGSLYFGTFLWDLYSIDSEFALNWCQDANGIVCTSPAIGPDGTVYYGSLNGDVQALNPDGSVKWIYMTNGEIRSSPAVDGSGVVYIGSRDSTLYAFETDGSLKWHYKTGGEIYSSPAITGDGSIIFGSFDHCVYSLTPDGDLNWSYETGDWVASSPAIDMEGTIYIGSHDGNLYALTTDGDPLWQCSVGAPIWTSSPAIGLNGDIYMGSSWNGTLNAVSPNGEFLWSYRCENSMFHTWMSSPAVGDDGTVYIHCVGFKLYALNPEGQLLWSGVMQGNAEANIMTSSPSISEDGILYIGSGSLQRGSLWAIDVDSGGLASTPWPKFRGNLKNTGRRYTDF